jgi:cytochrome c553
MKRALKWVGGLLGFILMVAIGAYATAYIATQSRLNQVYDVQVASVPVPDDEESIAHGKHLVASLGGCTVCHGDDLGGALEADTPPIAAIRGSNITQGKGSKTLGYSDTDWVRAIRHGLNRENKPIFFMPASAFINLSERDLGHIIAAIKTYPPVDREMEPSTLYPVGRVLSALRMFPLAHAEMIDHSRPMPAAVTSSEGIRFGEYAVNAGGCRDCHGETLRGGRVPGTPESIPPATDLTATGPLASYSEAEFLALFRTGKRPNGTTMHEMMPWKAFGRATDQELSAIFAYLKTVSMAEMH